MLFMWKRLKLVFLFSWLIQQDYLGNMPDGFDDYLTSRFPNLLIEVYKVIYEYCREERYFIKYFKRKVGNGVSTKWSTSLQPYFKKTRGGKVSMLAFSCISWRKVANAALTTGVSTERPWFTGRLLAAWCNCMCQRVVFSQSHSNSRKSFCIFIHTPDYLVILGTLTFIIYIINCWSR